MNKGTAIVGFFLCFLAGMGLMWGVDRAEGATIRAEGAKAGSLDQSAATVPVTGKDPQWGDADAPVTIVEFSDFQCPFCSRVEPTLKQIRDTYGKKKVRIVWKNQPLPFHQNARPAAEAAEAVFNLGGNDAFWKWHDTAFQNQQALNDDNYAKWARAAGVDVAKFKQAISSKKYSAKIDEDMALGTKLGATGTPAFRINGVTLVGAQPFDKFKEVIDAQLGEANKLIASGMAKDKVYIELTKKNAQVAPAPTQTAQQPPPEDTTVYKVAVSRDDPQKGPKDALVTIVEWSDFQCPFCKRVEPTLAQVATTYGNDVRFVWKDNPLPFHPRATPAAYVARAAFKSKGDKGFWDVHDALFESNPKLEDADLKTIAEKFGLDWSAIQKDIADKKYQEQLSASIDYASDLGARGTPAFFINGRKLSGAQPFDNFKKLIDEQLAKAKAMVAKGTPKANVYDEIMKEAKGPPPPEKKDVPAPEADSPWTGAANAKVVIQEWSDFQCPFCKRVEPTIKQILQEYKGKIKFVWHDMPLPFHQDAPLAAQAGREAYVQKGNAGFWAMHDKMFEAQGNPDGIKRAGLEKIAQDVGLDMDKFKSALDSGKDKARVDKDAAIASKAGISGTPSFVINGYYVSGAQPIEKFKKLIALAMKEAK